eukprot:tig00020704_g13148.t1
MRAAMLSSASGVFSTRPPSLQVRVAMAQDGSGQVRFSVTDQGPGIPLPAQQQLFCRFYRVKRTPADGADPGGTGLGLAICREICRVMGGSVGCISAPNQGSEFFFLVPPNLQAAAPRRQPPSRNNSESAVGSRERLSSSLRPSRALPSPRPRLPSRLPRSPAASATPHGSGDLTDDAAGAVAAFRPPPRPPRASPPRPRPAPANEPPALADPLSLFPTGFCSILVAEDNAVNARVVVGMLQKEKHSVTLAHDGAQAIELFETAAARAEPGLPPFDLILMDCSMPNVDGYAATAAIRRCEAARSLPRTLVAALTAHASKEDEVQCRESGMDLYLTKPIRKPQLLAAVGEARLRSARLRHAARGSAPESMGGERPPPGVAEGARLAPPDAEPAAS